jgi:26S proteasome regulatory subunit T1
MSKPGEAEASKKKPEKEADDKEETVEIKPLDEVDLKLLMRYGKGQYDAKLKKVEEEIKELNKKLGVMNKESDTGLAHPSQWFLQQDAQLIKEHPLIVARCNKIINPGTEDASYLIHIR